MTEESAHGGEAMRRIREHDLAAEIIVADNGQGIDADLLPHIFDRFRQGQATGIRQSGLGLGLAIVKTLVQLHHGTVRAESAGIGAGAAFIVELPLDEARQPAAAMTDTPNCGDSAEGCRAMAMTVPPGSMRYGKGPPGCSFSELMS